jgi:hypothetical protein
LALSFDAWVNDDRDAAPNAQSNRSEQPCYFQLAIKTVRDQNCAHEKLHENPVFGSDGGYLHGFICGGQASRLQKEWQELPDERQQGMQMRKELRL